MEDGEATAQVAVSSGSVLDTQPSAAKPSTVPQTADAERHAAVAALFKQHGEAVYGHCLRIVRERVLAEDLMQQVFLEALRDFDQFRGQSSRRTWLFGIANHRCLDALRSRRRGATEPHRDERAVEEPSVTGPFERLDHAQLLAALEECLALLSPEIRATVLTRYRTDLTFQQMATDLDASPDALQMRVARALPVLLKCLERKGWTK